MKRSPFLPGAVIPKWRIWPTTGEARHSLGVVEAPSEAEAVKKACEVISEPFIVTDAFRGAEVTIP